MATVIGVSRPKRHASHLALREALEGYLWITPWAIGSLIFWIGPVAYTFSLSLTEYNILNPPAFIGLQNFRTMLTDNLLMQAFRVTITYTLIVVPLNIVVGYSLAVLLNQEMRGLSIWRTLCYMPSIVPLVATSFIFMYMFSSDLGLINAVIRSTFHVQGPAWFGDPDWTMPAFILMALWGVGGGLILYLAALQGVPTTLYDAAKVDGANSWQRFRNVTIPMTSPVIFFTFLTGLIGTFQVFGNAFIITSGGPAYASLFYVLYLYKQGWGYLNMGYGSALAVLLFVILVILTMITLRVTGRLVYYELEGEAQ